MSSCDEKTYGREAEESPLLEAVIRERLMKTAGCKSLSRYCVICSVEIRDCVVITCVQVVNKSIHQSIPRL
jgi:hypothetical protein